MAKHTDAHKKTEPIVPGKIEVRYPDFPTPEPGLIGGPPMSGQPGGIHPHTNRGAATVTDDGGEITLSGQPRDEEGERPT